MIDHLQEAKTIIGRNSESRPTEHDIEETKAHALIAIAEGLEKIADNADVLDKIISFGFERGEQ